MSADPLFQIEEATIGGIHAAMQQGLLTVRQLVEMYLARIEAYDKKGPAIKSIITVNPKAIEEADTLDRRFRKSGITGSLHGICVLLKDNIETYDMPTTAGSESLKGYRPVNDAPVAKRLREAGAIILAKTNLHEFALWGETLSSILGQTLNPYDLTRTPGGSSGGTGASIAANFGTVGIGTDTVNSVRSPASACNLVGIRPTIGLVSRTGIIPYSLTQDTAGPIARSVSDAAGLLHIMAGYDPKDPVTAWSIGNIPDNYESSLAKDALIGARIGVLESLFGSGPEHAEVNKVIRTSIDLMKEKGAGIFSIKAPLDADSILAEVSVHRYELREHLTRYLQNTNPPAPVKSLEDIFSWGKYHSNNEPDIRKAMSLSVTDRAYYARVIRRIRLQESYLKIMADNMLDAIIFPHQKRLVVPIGQTQGDRNGVLTAVLGFPSIVVPAGFSIPTETAPLGVPVGIEFAGRPWSEPLLIGLAYSFEQATKFRHPPISNGPVV